MNMQNPVKR